MTTVYSSSNRNIIFTTIVMIMIGALLITVAPIPFGASGIAAVGNQSEVWVNQAWVTNGSGDIVDAQGHIFGMNAFATIQNGSNHVANNGIVHVAAGNYREKVIIDHPLTLSGAMAGVPGNDSSRNTFSGAESNIDLMDFVNALMVQANDVVIDGMQIKASTNGIFADGVNNLTVKNTRIIENIDNGITGTMTNSKIVDSYVLQWAPDSAPTQVTSASQWSNSASALNVNGWIGINVTGDNNLIANTYMEGTQPNMFNRPTYIFINYTGNGAAIKDNKIHFGGAANTVIAVTGDQAVIGHNVINVSNLNRYAVQVTGGNAQVTDNTLNVCNSGYDIINVYGDNALISANTLGNSSTYANYGVYLTGSKGKIADNIINVLSIRYYGIYSYGAGSTVTNNVVKNASEGIYVSGDYGTLQKNKITDFTGEYGIYVNGANTQILANTIANSFNSYSYYGIYHTGDFPTIEDNYESNVTYGIYDYGYGASICRNIIDNSLNVGSGISGDSVGAQSLGYTGIYHQGTHSKIDGNTILNNETLYSNYGINFDYGSAVEVKDNVISNAYNGIYTNGYNYYYSDQSVTEITIENNTVTNTGHHNCNIGVYVAYSDTVAVNKNNISATTAGWDSGIYLYYDRSITIDDNTLMNVSSYGMYLYYCSGKDVVITNNKVTNNNRYAYTGMYMLWLGSGSIITDNQIISNGNSSFSYGIYQIYAGQSTVKNNRLFNVSEGIHSEGWYDYYNYYYYYGGHPSADDSVYENNTIVSNLTSANGGIYLWRGSHNVVKDNVIVDNTGYMDHGIYAYYTNALNVTNNTVSNAWNGVTVYTNDYNLAYGINVDKNTIANSNVLSYVQLGQVSQQVHSGTAIGVYGDNNGSISNNNISSTAGYWGNGIIYYGYESMIDGNSLTNTSNGILYESLNYGDTSMGAILKQMDAELANLQKDHPNDPLGNNSSVSTASSMALSTLPVSNFATIQNNLVNNSNMTDRNNGIMYYGSTGAIADNVIMGGSNNATFGIGAYIDNVTITGNTVTNVTMPLYDANNSITGGAIFIESANPGTIKGNAYLSYNNLYNNRVQLVLDNITVYNVDGKGTLAALDNATLRTILGANSLDKAYYVTYADGSLKGVDGSAISDEMNYNESMKVVIVWALYDDANTTAAEGDKVVKGTYTHTYHLVPGWNLVSVSLNVPNNTPDGFFPANVKGEVVDLWGWNSSAQKWTYYSPDPNTPYKGYEPITTLDAGKGYWVNANSSVWFVVEGTIPAGAPNATVPLVSKWNLVGLTGICPSTPAALYPTGWDVWEWNATAQNWKYYSPDPNTPYKGYEPITTIQPGEGVWVNI